MACALTQAHVRRYIDVAVHLSAWLYCRTLFSHVAGRNDTGHTLRIISSEQESHFFTNQ